MFRDHISTNETDMEEVHLDALVVGAGFGGIYQLKKLRDLGFNVKAIDAAGDVGGTWWWNQYPGAMSDTEAYLYRYSWDHEDLQTYPWTHHYVYQQEVLAYLRHVVAKYDLRRDIWFETELTGAHWDGNLRRWVVETRDGGVIHTHFLITALGLLSRQNFPEIPGLNDFEGEKYHTGAWPQDVALAGKRVGVIGNGSTGVQIITEVAKYAGNLVSFQRNPQYSVPSGQREVDPAYRRMVNENYTRIWAQVKDESDTGFGFKENKDRPVFSVDAARRNELFEEAWKKGGGFRFMFESFNDIATNEAANKEACEFIKRKIRETVKDAGKADKLMPTQLYARRPLCDAGYYEQFNRDNVDVVSLNKTPIRCITKNGIQTADGTNHVLDVIIFATGFDAVDGNYTRIAIKGRNGETLKDHWSEAGPTTYLGLNVSGFPNMFMITGPNGPFSNIPPAIETHVEFISDTIAWLASRESQSLADIVIEASAKAEQQWTEECDRISQGSLFRKTDSWIFGANVPGKKHAVMFYFGGLAEYRRKLREIVKDGWRGFEIS
ncbi:FAD/NAD(P)-binding domain-containing protein [Hortaea werneckii]|nr:FAD/NAD(P)-binding domain-containing protein [Hortaea werneckii]